MCRKQWAAPRGSLVKVFATANETSSSGSSMSAAGSDAYTVNTLTGCNLADFVVKL